jgi:hypothetical protein
MKYSKEELAELAKGVFKDDKESPMVYADDEGTFRTPQQYAAMKKEGKHTGFTNVFKNPNVKEGTAAAPASDPEMEKKLAEALKEIDRLNTLKSVKEAKAALDAKDAEIAELKAKLDSLTPKP